MKLDLNFSMLDPFAKQVLLWVLPLTGKTGFTAIIDLFHCTGTPQLLAILILKFEQVHLGQVIHSSGKRVSRL